MKAKSQNHRASIEGTNASIIATIAFCVFIVVLCFVVGRVLWSQRSYQAKIITKKETARDTLVKNVSNIDQLKKSYSVFVAANPNVLGGAPQGKGEKDGDNAQIILDALPSKYDFPALATSIEKITKQNSSIQLTAITGKDDELLQVKTAKDINPKPVAIPLTIGATASSFTGSNDLLSILERSIRPFKITKLNITASNGVTVSVDMNTYYQPEKSIGIKKEVVKQ